MTTREKMIQHIHSINKVLTVQWLNELSNEELLANCHPSDREQYASDLKVKAKVK
jgi:hypothetical protein